MAMVDHSDTEFTLDFIYVLPQQNRAKVHSRIITSPKHMKRLVQAMQENLSRYEAKYGAILLRDDDHRH
jgi:anti-sigma-K factor RskA